MRYKDNLKSPIIKRSVAIEGHKTSISMEEEFWNGLKEIAESERLTVSSLVTRVDRERTQGNLSSALRTYVLRHYRARCEGRQPAVVAVAEAGGLPPRGAAL